MADNIQKPRWQIGFLVAMIVFAIFMKLFSYYLPKAVIVVGDKRSTVLVAKNYQNLYKGLSGRENLTKYEGMLFVFPDRGQHTMVMRDMKMTIDIIWLDYGKVVDIAPNRPPEPNKTESELIKYNARGNSTMVLETIGGWAEANGLKIGDTIRIEK